MFKKLNSLWKYLFSIGDVIIVVVPIIIVILFLTLLFRNNYKKDFDLKKEKLDEIVEKVKSNELQIDEKNMVILTDEYKGIVKYDYVDVYSLDDEKVLIEFYYRPGFPDDGQSFYYSSDGEGLLKEYLDESRYSRIEKLDDNWYFVQFN